MIERPWPPGEVSVFWFLSFSSAQRKPRDHPVESVRQQTRITPHFGNISRSSVLRNARFSSVGSIIIFGACVCFLVFWRLEKRSTKDAYLAHAGDARVAGDERHDDFLTLVGTILVGGDETCGNGRAGQDGANEIRQKIIE